MRSTDLSREQVEKLIERLRPTLGYLTRLQRRMEDEKFDSADDVLLAVHKSQAAMQELVMALHYLTCSGVGRGETHAR